MSLTASRHRLWVLLASGGLLLLAGPVAHAQTKTGTTFGAFLLIEPSARIAGMGNVGSTIGDDLQAVYYNPGAAGQLDRRAVTFSHGEWIADIDFNFAALAFPIGNRSALYGSVTTLRSGDIAVRTVAQPLGTGELFQVNDIAVGLGYGYRVSPRFSAGAQVSFLQETIWHSSASTMVLSVGTLYRVSADGLRIGASITNLGTDARFGGQDLRVTFDEDPDRFGDNGTLPAEQHTDAFPVPILFRVGLGMPQQLSEDARVFWAVDAYHPSDNSESVSLGGEFEYRELLSLRAGYQNLFQTDSEVGLTLGAGLSGRLHSESLGYGIDYAWADHGRLSDTHRITLSVDF